MKLYYGSQTAFQNPTFGQGNPNNDYGLGFYLTQEKRLAELWAGQYPNGGYAISFSLKMNDLRVLRLDDSSAESILRWIALLTKYRFSYVRRIEYQQTIDWLNRHFPTAVDDYDVIVGYRADDAYFNYSLGFVSGSISLETLSLAMKLGNLGLQYVLKSREAFSRLEYISCEAVAYSDEYKAMRERTLEEYHRLVSLEDPFGNTFIGEIMKRYGK